MGVEAGVPDAEPADPLRRPGRLGKRDGHPTAPLLLVSPIFCPIQEHTPGPIAPDFDGGRMRIRALGDASDGTRLTLTLIRDELSHIATARAATDSNLHYLDGRSLYGAADLAELPLPDGLHPDPDGHRRIGNRFAELTFGNDGPFPAGLSASWS